MGLVLVLVPDSRRLAAPNSKLGSRPPNSNSNPSRKPLSKADSSLHVPDSEDERPNANGRGKSPMEQVAGAANRALQTATFYLTARSKEPQDTSGAANNQNGNDSSYDYGAEESIYQASQGKRTSNAAHKRNRISVDNKAWKPSASDFESDEEYSDDGKKGRGAKKKGPHGGPLTNLPSIGPSKGRKKKTKGNKGSKGNIAGGEHENESDGETQTDIQSQSAQLRSSAQPSRPSIPRSIPPENYDPEDTSVDVEQGLHSIPEIDDIDLPPEDLSAQQRARSMEPKPKRRTSRSRTPARERARFSIGGALGSIVNLTFKGSMSIVTLFLHLLSNVLFLLGRVFGTMFDIVFNRPYLWVKSSRAKGLATFAKYVFLAATLVSAWFILRSPTALLYIPKLSFPSSSSTRHSPVYTAPEVPAANIVELAERLLRIENALSGLSVDSERAKAKADDGIRGYHDLMGRLGVLETRLGAESRKIVEAETRARDAAGRGLSGVKQDVEVLQAQIVAQQKLLEREEREKGHGHKQGHSSDEEARVKLKALEERVGFVEGGVRDALELGTKASSVAAAAVATAGNNKAPAAAIPGTEWWNKRVKSGLQIKSSDGTDVTALIADLVDTATSIRSKDTIAKPDYALHSGGARIIPSLTTPTFEIRPSTLRGQVVGLLTGNGYAIGRPPITALHHEVNNGHCWPFAGSEGQLGVALAAPTYVEEVSVDHVAKELAFDMRSAPREMEVWGMVEGKDNVGRVKEWKEHSGGQEILNTIGYPTTLPREPEYIRLANFTYDVGSTRGVQTFPVDEDVRRLGVDFGIVVLRVLSNWGQGEFTCLYRFRVHGQRMVDGPPPMNLGEDASP